MSEFIITLKDKKTGKTREITHTNSGTFYSPEQEMKVIKQWWTEDEGRFEVVSIKRLNHR